MPCHESIADAKASFVSSVSMGIKTLMQECGFSRERAISAMMRELNRGEASRPTDTEIFTAMKRYNLGLEEATRTLIIIKALGRTMKNKSPSEAIEILTDKISLRNLLYESSEEDPSSEDELTIRPELRVEPAKFGHQSPVSIRKSLSSSRISKLAAKAGRQRMKTPLKNSSGRKRSMDEMESSDKKEAPFQTKRERSDSISAEVDAKLAKQTSEENPANDPVMRPQAGVRSKRALRSEEPEALNQPSSHKRVRGSEG